MLFRKIDFYIACLVILADQVSKYAVIHSKLAYGPLEVTSFFNLVLRFNTGVGFSLFNTWQPWQLLALVGVILIFIVVLYAKSQRDIEKKAFALLVSGALSNALDRLHLKGVTDFLDFHAFGYHWPAFNMADMAIVLGCALLLLSDFLKKK